MNINKINITKKNDILDGITEIIKTRANQNKITELIQLIEEDIILFLEEICNENDVYFNEHVLEKNYDISFYHNLNTKIQNKLGKIIMLTDVLDSLEREKDIEKKFMNLMII